MVNKLHEHRHAVQRQCDYSYANVKRHNGQQKIGEDDNKADHRTHSLRRDAVGVVASLKTMPRRSLGTCVVDPGNANDAHAEPRPSQTAQATVAVSERKLNSGCTMQDLKQRSAGTIELFQHPGVFCMSRGMCRVCGSSTCVINIRSSGRQVGTRGMQTGEYP
eukprot:3225619-Rhodomonas_salina.1